jgi:S1-C subfamily serine protease
MSDPVEHFLDDAVYDWSKAEAVELYEIMVRAYGAVPSANLIAAKSGIDRTRIDFAQPPRDFWKQALEVAAAAGRTRQLAQNARSDSAIAGYHRKLDRLVSLSPVQAEAPIKEPIEWSGNELITGNQETFLEMHFLHEGLRIAASVVRLGALTQRDKSFYGTGFLIASDTILTNHHVLHDYKDGKRPVKCLDILFNYELDAANRPREVDRYEGDVSTITGDAEHDWAIIRPHKSFKNSYPALSLRPVKPAMRGDFVYIVQHPQGRLKKIGLLHNEVVNVTHSRVHYLTDTLPGSSGSPVCNEFWQVVALHQRGIKGDPEKGAIFKNQGIPIERVVEGLTARGILKPAEG